MKKLIGIVAILLLAGCTQESQNKLGRAIQNFTGSDGVLEIYSGGKIMKRIIKIDKISTAYGTDESQSRAYRYGYGFVDLNLNFKVDSDEKKSYFEFSDYSSNYLFFENPQR
jgi:hypothetical protein